MTELEILRRRRELVVLSAQLQRATLVRRLDRVTSHPAQLVLGAVSSVATIPLLFKLGSVALRMLGRKPAVRARRRGRPLLQKLVSALKYAPLLKAFPVPKFFHR